MKKEILNAIKGSFTTESNIFASIVLPDKTNRNSNVLLSTMFTNKVLDFGNLLKGYNPNTGDLLDKDIKLLEGITGTALINTELSIYEKYTSLCPAQDAGIEDVSYYQKKKFDMAIEKAGGEGNLAYVMVEITGIFAYIFNFRQNDSGTLKRMRARSYICILISRAISLYILNELKLPRCNVLDDGGELFGILFNKKDIQYIKKCLKQIKEELIRKFDGNINLLYVIKDNISNNDLMKNSVGLMKYLSEGLYENEFHQFDDIPDMFSDATFKLQSPLACDYCSRDFAPKHEDGCELCRKEFDIGSRIPKAEYLISFVSDDEDSLDKADVSFFSKTGFIFCKKDEVKKKIEGVNASYIDISSVNSTNFVEKILCMDNVSYSFITIGNAVHLLDNGQIMDFDQMKENATGAEYLSALKIDADNFGKVTIEGFNDITNLLRIATISVYFKYFFQGYLTNIIEAKNGYTVYSGGDDLFLIAPWDKMIDLSMVINGEFQRFTGNNEFLSLTGGVSIFTGTIPVKRIQNLANAEESMAKRTKKNGIAIFNKLYEWTDISGLKDFIFKEVIDISFSDYQKPFGNSLIYDLHRLTSEIERNNLMAIPLLYHRLRNNPEILQKLRAYIIDKNDAYKFHFIANYCSLFVRRKK